MKRLPLIIDLKGINLSEEEKNLPVQELVSISIKNIILGWGRSQQKGMLEESRRLFYKISDALETAVKEGKDSIDLEDQWFEFIKKCKREVGIVPNLFLRKIEDLIDSVKER